MDITNSNNVSVTKSDSVQAQSKSQTSNRDKSDVKFSEELKSASKNMNTKESDKKASKETKEIKETKEMKESKSVKKDDSKDVSLDKNNQGNVDEAINGLNNVLDELASLNQKDEIVSERLKPLSFYDDKDNKEGLSLIDNNMNIQEPQDKFNLQNGANMNFNSDGQPFAQFVNQDKTKDVLNSSVKDLAEEKAIMSTMEENLAIANKNIAISKTRTIENEHGVQKVDKKSNLVVDTVVSYDRVVMDKADVEFFANLVENGFLDIKEVQNAEKSSRVSKALADLLAKAMNDNKPVRIDFDNNISVIIKIDRAGKISADFLPSSQVAEAYLKENLPLLRQRFDDNNIDYNELNQRERKQDNQEDNNRRKGHKDE